MPLESSWPIIPYLLLFGTNFSSHFRTKQFDVMRSLGSFQLKNIFIVNFNSFSRFHIIKEQINKCKFSNNIIRIKSLLIIDGKEVKYLYFHFPRILCRLSIENQPMESGILTHPSRYKRAESNLLADQKSPNTWAR